MDATLLLTKTDVDAGLASIWWTRPYLNPATTGPSDKYVWFGSTDHAAGDDHWMYRGFSAARDVAPAPGSWVLFRPPGPDPHKETPFVIHNPGHARPFGLLFHSFGSDSGGNQNTRLVAHTGLDFENGTDEGRVPPLQRQHLPDHP